MSSKDRGASGGAAKEILPAKTDGDFAALQSCLIGGDAEQTGRERKLRRRSLVLSTLMQVVVLLAVIAVPFFSKAERIAVKDFVPIPPYRARGGAREQALPQAPPADPKRTFCLVCPRVHPTGPTSLGSHDGATGPEQPNVDNEPYNQPGAPCPECINIGRAEPVRPVQPPAQPTVVRVTHLDPAMLIERIEPTYPPLAKQIRRSGRVELHALISTDGRIESLEVVSGDVLFYPSALDAVRRWRYRPTMLNGQAVKVDTYITVVYTLQ